MIDLFFIFVGIVLLFLSLLILKSIFLKKLKFDVCALCFSVSLTWIVLLILRYFGRFDNVIIISLLMGGSIVGIFYVIERKVKEDVTLFRLPFFLTLVFLGYSLINFSSELLKIFFFLIGLWGLFFVLYLYRTKPLLKEKVQKMVECCKRW